MDKALKGDKFSIDFGNGSSCTFTTGGRKRHDFGDGTVMVNGRIQFADGTEAYCLLEIDEMSSGEHCGTGVLLRNGIAWQNDPNFGKLIGKTDKQIYPYRYKYTARVRCDDHHVGVDGWSR